MRRVMISLSTVCLLALVFSTTAFAQRRGGAPAAVRTGFGQQRSFQGFNHGYRQQMAPMRQAYGHQGSYQGFNHGYRQHMAPGHQNYGHYRPHQQFHHQNQYHRGPMHQTYGNHRPPYQQFHHRNQYHRGPVHQAYGHDRSRNTWGRPPMAAAPSHQGWQGRQVPPGWSQGNRNGWHGNTVPPGWENANGQRPGWQGHQGNRSGWQGNTPPSQSSSPPVTPAVTREVQTVSTNPGNPAMLNPQRDSQASFQGSGRAGSYSSNR